MKIVNFIRSFCGKHTYHGRYHMISFFTRVENSMLCPVFIARGCRFTNYTVTHTQVKKKQ